MAEKHEEKASIPIHLSNPVSTVVAAAAVSPIPSSLSSDSGSSPGADKAAAERERQRQREQERRKREAVSITFLPYIFRLSASTGANFDYIFSPF
jgi:hypothetical protein